MGRPCPSRPAPRYPRSRPPDRPGRAIGTRAAVRPVASGKYCRCTPTGSESPRREPATSYDEGVHRTLGSTLVVLSALAAFGVAIDVIAQHNPVPHAGGDASTDDRADHVQQHARVEPDPTSHPRVGFVK